MKEELRLYSFVNFYLSSIQQGIQTGHMTDYMSLKYLIRRPQIPRARTYADWIENHKTYIVLNGGDHTSVNTIYSDIAKYCEHLNLPFGNFTEPGLGDIMTCCGAVIPERFFNVEYDRDGDVYRTLFDIQWGEANAWVAGSPEYELVKLIKSKPLAK